MTRSWTLGLLALAATAACTPGTDAPADTGPGDTGAPIDRADARTTGSDAAVTEPDAGPGETDAGSHETDAGPGEHDAGPGTDGGGSTGGTVLTCAENHDEVVQSRGGESRFASLAWTGSEYGVAWQDDQDGDWEIYFARVGTDGSTREVVRVTETGGADEYPSLAWDGARFWVSWAHNAGDTGALRAVALTRNGDETQVGTATVVSTGSAGPIGRSSARAIPASAGGGLAIAWEDGRLGESNHEIYYARLNASGARVGSDVRVTNAARGSEYPLLAWNSQASEFGLVWLDDRDGHGAYPNEEVYFARILPSGARPAGASDVRVTDDPQRSVWPSLTYDGTGYAIAWANETEVPDRPRIYFAQLSAAGAMRNASEPKLLSSNDDSVGAWTTAIAWSGTEYLVTWEDQRHEDGDLIVRRISAGGAPSTPEVFLAGDGTFSGHPSLVWSGDAWALAWEDNRHDHRDIWFRRLGRSECKVGE